MSEDENINVNVMIIYWLIIVMIGYLYMDPLQWFDVRIQRVLCGTDSVFSIVSPQWFQNPDFDLFSPYVERRQRRPDQPFYILHPEFIWSLWDVIQDNTEEPIQPNPPSSGFTGK